MVADGQTLEQVYFSGCHGDVGGGTVVGGSIDDSTRLCDITLGYIVKKAQGAGLVFDDAFIQQCGQLAPEFALDLLHESSPRVRLSAAKADCGDGNNSK